MEKTHRYCILQAAGTKFENRQKCRSFPHCVTRYVYLYYFRMNRDKNVLKTYLSFLRGATAKEQVYRDDYINDSKLYRIG